MQRDELTREEAIRRHRTMWNWLADQAETTGKLHSKFNAMQEFREYREMCEEVQS